LVSAGDKSFGCAVLMKPAEEQPRRRHHRPPQTAEGKPPPRGARARPARRPSADDKRAAHVRTRPQSAAKRHPVGPVATVRTHYRSPPSPPPLSP